MKPLTKRDVRDLVQEAVISRMAAGGEIDVTVVGLPAIGEILSFDGDVGDVAFALSDGDTRSFRVTISLPRKEKP